MIHFGPGAFAAAFAAGVVSFVSPCVLPLVPGYLSFVSGVGFGELGARPRRVVGQTAWFVIGFGMMFALLGVGAAWFGNTLLVHRRSLEIAAGAFIALAGVIYAGLPLPALLLAERRVHLRREGTGPLTALVAGLAFAIGWTPCIGPTLAAILTLAAGTGHAGQGAVLLLVYALGLGVPFLLFGLAFTRALGLSRALRAQLAAGQYHLRCAVGRIRRAARNRRADPVDLAALAFHRFDRLTGAPNRSRLASKRVHGDRQDTSSNPTRS